MARNPSPARRRRRRSASPAGRRVYGGRRGGGVPPAQAPAIASALGLLTLVSTIFAELCLDLAALVACVGLLALPWQWRSCWTKIRAATGQRHRRLAVFSSVGMGAVDFLVAPLWLVVNMSYRRGSYARFVREHAAFAVVGVAFKRGHGRFKRDVPPFTGRIWWAATGHTVCLLCADVRALPWYALAALGWRRSVFYTRCQTAPDVSYALALGTDDYFVKRIALVPVLSWGVAVAASLRSAGGLLRAVGGGVCLLLLLAVAWDQAENVPANNKIVDTGRMLELRTHRGHPGWRTIAGSEASHCLGELALWVVAVCALVFDPFRVPGFYREARDGIQNGVDVADAADNVTHACKDVLERVALDALGVAAVSLVAATLYRSPALCGCRQCSRAARDPFRAGPRDWDIHARGLAKDVVIDLVHAPLALVLLLAPWRVPQCWRSMRHALGIEHRREVLRQEAVLALIDLLTLLIVLLIVITLIRLPSLIAALRSRRKGEGVRQAVFRHMRHEFKTESFKMMEKRNPFDASELVPEDPDEVTHVDSTIVYHVSDSDSEHEGDTTSDDDDAPRRRRRRSVGRAAGAAATRRGRTRTRAAPKTRRRATTPARSRSASRNARASR